MAVRRRTLARRVGNLHHGNGPIFEVEVRQIMLEHQLAAALSLCVRKHGLRQCGAGATEQNSSVDHTAKLVSIMIEIKWIQTGGSCILWPGDDTWPDLKPLRASRRNRQRRDGRGLQGP